jgi:hypothetical protein
VTNMDEFVGIIGTVVGVLSFIYAIYENRQRAKLIDYNREQAWEIYRQSSTTLLFYQNVEKKKNEIDDKNIIEDVIRGETSSSELVRNSIRMIKRFEKKFDNETIDRWYKEGKIPNESHVEAFKKLI